MTEIIESIKNTVLDRVTSPLFGTFALAWSILNWKIFLIAFAGDLSPALRIHIISDNYLHWHNTIAWPTVSTLAFLGVYPYLAVFSTWLWERKKPQKKEIFLRYQNLTPISPEERDKLSKAFELETSEMQSRLQAKDIRINVLTEELDSFRAQQEIKKNQETTEGISRVEKPINNREKIKQKDQTLSALKQFITGTSLPQKEDAPHSSIADEDHYPILSDQEEILLINIFNTQAEIFYPKDIENLTSLVANKARLMIEQLKEKKLIEGNSTNGMKMSVLGLKYANVLSTHRGMVNT